MGEDSFRSIGLSSRLSKWSSSIRLIAAILSLLTSWLLTLATFYWMVQKWEVVATAAFIVTLVVSITLTALTPWSRESVS